MPAAAIAPPPPIREGDRLDSAEFIRRWEAMPSLKHAELIDGVVLFMPSPVLPHGNSHTLVTGWLWLYGDLTPGTDGANDTTWIMGPKDVPQPDIALRILPECGGQSGMEGIYATGAPELVVEVSGSTLSRDLGTKLELYQRAGVLEYLTILPHAKQLIWAVSFTRPFRRA